VLRPPAATDGMSSQMWSGPSDSAHSSGKRGSVVQRVLEEGLFSRQGCGRAGNAADWPL